MKNTTSTKTILIFLALLLAALVFWRWSLYFQTAHMVTEEKVMEVPSSNEDLDAELEASINSNSEIELKAVDGEF